MMMQTADEIGRLGFDAIKLHNLYAVRGTPLGDQVLDGKGIDDGIRGLRPNGRRFFGAGPAEVVVERVSGDAPPNYLIEPKWCLEKSALRRAIEMEFARRGTRQGSQYTPPELLPADRPVPDDLTPEAIRAGNRESGEVASFETAAMMRLLRPREKISPSRPDDLASLTLSLPHSRLGNPTCLSAVEWQELESSLV